MPASAFRPGRLAVLLALGLAGVSLQVPSAADFSASVAPPDQAASLAPHAGDLLAQLPLYFERNTGRFTRDVEFVSRGDGYELFLTAHEAVLALRGGRTPVGEARIPVKQPDPRMAAPAQHDGQPRAVVRMRLVGGDPRARLEPGTPLAGKAHYLVGNDPRRWRRDVALYDSVRMARVWRGVDLVYHGRGQALEYDLVVAPGASAQRIQLAFAGVDDLTIDDAGDLVLHTGGGLIRQHRPVAYQTIAGRRRPVETAYVRRGARNVGFRVGAYDRRHPLVIDPVLGFSTFLGGNTSDVGNAVAVDSSGNVYVAGQTASNFPLFAAQQSSFGGGFGDAFVVKLNSAGSLVYATYYGGNGTDTALGIAADGSGNAYLTGRTTSTDLDPVNAVQAAYASDIPAFPCHTNAFVAKLNATGSTLLYSTYLGGRGDHVAGDIGNRIAVDAGGNAYVTGSTTSLDFPTQSALQAALAGHFVQKSTNGGTSWTPVETGLPTRRIEDLVVDPQNPANVYATVAGGGLFKSTNGGTNWFESDVGIPIGGEQTDLVIDPVTPTTLYVSGGSDTTACFYQPGILKTTNGGASWAFKINGLTNFDVRALAIAPQTPSTLFAGGPGALFNAASSPVVVFKSTDGGESWSPSDTGIDRTGNSIDAIAVAPSNSSIVYAIASGGSASGIFKSSDGGASWSRVYASQFGFTGDVLAIDPVNPNTVYSEQFNGILKTTDGGTTWNVKANGLGSSLVNALVIDPNAPATIYAATAGGLFKSTNGADNWSLVDVASTNRPSVRALALDASLATDTIFAVLDREPDAFLAKLGTTGTPLTYSTYLGGRDDDQATGLAVDGTSNVYLTGTTTSADFPTNAPLDSFANGTCGSATFITACSDAFVTKINAAGSALVYSTPLGGTDIETGGDIAVDGGGNAYVTGSTTSLDFPTVNALQGALAGNATFRSSDAFVAKLNAGGSALVYSTYLGGTSLDSARTIAVDAAGNATIAGSTFSDNLPLKNPLQCPGAGFGSDGFVTQLSASGSALNYSTYLSSSGSDSANDVALDGAGNAYVIGNTDAGSFPTVNPLQGFGGGNCGTAGFPSPCSDTFVSKLARTGTSGADVVVAKCADAGFFPTVGNTITYTVYVSNAGPSTATGVTLADPLPSQVSFVSVATTVGNCTEGATVSCDIGTLAPDEGAVVTIVTTAAAAGVNVANTATGDSTSSDPNAANDAATATVTINPRPKFLDPFHCYRTKPAAGAPKFTPIIGVTLADQFESRAVDVKKPLELCTPGSLGAFNPADADTHLERYGIKLAKGSPKHVKRTGIAATTALHSLHVDTTGLNTLLVPTAKDLTAPATPPDAAAHDVDHYTCYKAKLTKGEPKLPKNLQLTIRDQFQTARRYLVGKPTRLCVPVDKNGEGTKQARRLLCYKVKAAKGRCDNTAPSNAGAACKKEEDCGGAKGQTTLCVKQTKFLPVAGANLANQFDAERVDVVAEGEVCLPAN